MICVNFYEKADSDLIRCAVIAAKYRGKWVFCRHKERKTWEFPGGHIEKGETAEAAAGRELYEETGALEYRLYPVAAYSGPGCGPRFSGQPTDWKTMQICQRSNASRAVIMRRVFVRTAMPHSWSLTENVWWEPAG